MIEHFDLISEIPPPHYKMLRSFSTSNPSLQQTARIPTGIPDGGIGNASNISSAASTNNNVQVEYEVSVPVVQSFRHTPYHSLWNLNQWFVLFCFFFILLEVLTFIMSVFSLFISQKRKKKILNIVFQLFRQHF